MASVTVYAWRPSSAVAAVEVLLPELAGSADAVVTVRAVGAANSVVLGLDPHGIR